MNRIVKEALEANNSNLTAIKTERVEICHYGRAIYKPAGFCDHYKIGILSGKKNYTPQQIRYFVAAVNALNLRGVYWKKSLKEFTTKKIAYGK